MSQTEGFVEHSPERATQRGRQALLDNQKRSLRSAIHLLVKAFSWRAVSESFKKFQPTTSRKNLDSVLDPGYGFVRWGYMDFQEAGNNRGLLHSCGRMCTTDPQTIHFDSSKATEAYHCIPLCSSNIIILVPTNITVQP